MRAVSACLLLCGCNRTGGNAPHVVGGGMLGTGGGTGAAVGVGAQGGTAGAGTPASGAMANPAPGSKLFVGANFWNIDWEGQDNYFQKGVDFSRVDNPWRPDLLTDLGPYRVLRFMDWNQTNDPSNRQASWQTRKLPTDVQSEPVAFEWQIDLCNRARADYWVNLPHESTQDTWAHLAQLVHDRLSPNLRVYVEWSNEVWNSSFPQSSYASDQGKSLGLAGGDPAASFYVYSSVRLFEAFEAVFGAGSPRLVKVLAGQAAWNGPCQAHVKALSDPQINPRGTKADVYAVAPYFTGSSLDDLRTAITQAAGWVGSSATCARSAGLPLVSYEGGQDSFGAPNNGCEGIQTDPAMHDVYGSYLDALVGAGLTGPFMQYTHTGSCWGLKVKTGDPPASAPKYVGLVDWLAAHP
jgi:hypothetical protein